jgi:hypothetical protein
MPSRLLPRAAIALVWLYQGLWMKLLGRALRHQKIVGAVVVGTIREPSIPPAGDLCSTF